jgi:cytochrome c oxidase subunit 2
MPVLEIEHGDGGESLHIPANGGRLGRLAKLVPVPLVGLVLAACGEQPNANPTGDDNEPGLFALDGDMFPHEVVTAEGAQAAGLYLPIFLIAVVIFVLIEGLLLYMAWRFRRKDGDSELPEQTHGNNRLEIIWTAIPAAIVSLLFIASTIVLTDVEAKSDDPAVTVEVTAYQFGWIFDYPEYPGVSVAGGGRGDGAPEMVVPVNESIRFRLQSIKGPDQTDEELAAGAAPSGGVIHSFYVPSFFFKRDIIPGRITEFEVTVEKPGTYGGQCAEFCGLAHGDMYFSVQAVERAEFDDWIAEQTGGAETATAGEGEAGDAPAGESSETAEEAA